MHGAICTSSMRFKHLEAHRTFSKHILTELAACIDFFHTSSGWFNWTEPSPTTALQGIQGVQGASAPVRGGSLTANLIEPSLTTAL